MIKEFREFIMRGNVLDLAVGIIIGAAFTSVVNSLVNDIIMPPIGLLISGIDFSNITILLRAAEGDNPAVTINIGLFINAVITFLITAFAVFLVIKAFNEANRRTRQQKQEAPAAPPAPTTDEKILATLEKLNSTLTDLAKKVS
jgi:large conductance mechanosensitive channel